MPFCPSVYIPPSFPCCLYFFHSFLFICLFHNEHFLFACISYFYQVYMASAASINSPHYIALSTALPISSASSSTWGIKVYCWKSGAVFFFTECRVCRCLPTYYAAKKIKSFLTALFRVCSCEQLPGSCAAATLFAIHLLWCGAADGQSCGC